jgi:molybdopterin biosynthesis enzyme
VICNATKIVDLTANDSDPEGNLPLTVTDVSVLGYSTATAEVISAGAIRVFGAEIPGGALAVYSVRDSLGATSTGNVTITTTGSRALCFR